MRLPSFVVWLLRRLERRARHTPYFHLDGYMNRWWVVPFRADLGDGTGPVSPWRRPIAWLFQRFDIAFRLHEILRSDLERNAHDHPWPYVTIILRGGYVEQRFDELGRVVSQRWHGPGSVLYRPANSWHRLHLPAGQSALTLFISGSKCQSWGFNVNGVKVHWREYLGEQ